MKSIDDMFNWYDLKVSSIKPLLGLLDIVKQSHLHGLLPLDELVHFVFEEVFECTLLIAYLL